MKFINLEGTRFGRLVVMSRARNVCKKTAWNCVCDCGNSCVVRSASLRRGLTRSCGCLKHDETVKRNIESVKHNATKTRLFRIWSGMKTRCLNKSSKDWTNYGGRGVKVCEDWKNSFIEFKTWALSAGYSDELTIDRIDANGNYCPENCRWVPSQKQSANRRCNITHDGVCVSEWCRRTGNSFAAVIKRIHNGWDVERALFTPVRPKKH